MRGGKPALGIAIVVASLGLGGCAETTLFVHTAKQLGHGDGKPLGIYKVGDPYQINGVWYYPAEDYNYSETGIASFYGGEAKGTNFHGRTTANGELYDMNALTAAHQTLPLPSLVRVTNLENGRSVVLRVNDRGPFVRGRIIDVSRRSAQLLGFEAQGTARVRVDILADDSRALKLTLLRGTSGGAETQVAAAPRAAVASDALPPPPGSRASTTIATATLPPPSATLPPTDTAIRSGRPKGKVTQQPGARPAPAVVAEPAQSAPAGRPSAPLSGQTPVSEASTNAVVTQTATRPTSLFIQAGAFANYENAHRMSARLSRYGHTKVTPVSSGDHQLYRVRIGPINSVQEADSLLAELSPIVPQAHIIVD